MPSSSSFSGSNLTLQSVEAYGPATVRVTYTFAPLAADSAGANDALNASNYTLTGPAENTILSVAAVPSNARAFDILLDFPLSNGDYVLAVEDVETEDADPLVSPTSMAFAVSGVTGTAPVGLETDGAQEVIEKHFPLRGVNWNALITAVAESDEESWATAAEIFDQLFTSSAGGEYLVRRAADYGIKKPLNIGMSDEQFRKFAIKATNGKLTQSAALQLLEVFYGQDALHAHTTTTLAEPFALEDGMTLSFLVDEANTIDITFSEDEFSQIQNANAAEIAASITRAFEYYNVKGSAVPYEDPDTGEVYVRVYSASFGLSSALRVTGGSAQNILKFPEELSTYTTSANVTWQISATGVGEVTFLTTSTNVDLSIIEEGDYINVFSDVIPETHEGAFSIVSVDIRYNGATKEQRFIVQNDDINAAISLTTYAGTPVGDVTFFRPKKYTVHNSNGRTVVVAQQGENELDIVLPATAEIVSRTDTDAAYMQEMTEIEFDTVERLADEIKITTTEPHSLAVGDYVLIEGFFSTYTEAAIVTGDPGETDTSKKTILSSIDAMAYGRYYHSVTAYGENKALIVGGKNDSMVVNDTSIEFAITGQLNGDDEPPQYSYEWSAEVTMPYGCLNHKTFPLSNPYTGEKLITIGGDDGTGVALDTSMIYDPSTHLWALGPTFATGLSLFDGCVLDDDYIVFCGGSEDFMTTSNLSFMYVPSTNSIVSTGDLVHARCDHRVTRLDNDFALASGGRAPQGATTDYIYLNEGEVLRYAEVFNGSTWSATGSMGIARYNHAAVLLPNGEVLVCGGQGYNPTNESVSRILDECELYDPRTGRWRPTGRLSFARQAHVAFVIPGTRKVVIIGGTGTDQDEVIPQTEYYDIDTGRWGTCPAEMTMNATDSGYLNNNNATMLTNDTILIAGGYDPGATDSALGEARLFVRNGDKIAAGDVNGFKQIIEVGSDWFKLDSEFDAYAGDALGETRVFAVAAPEGEWPGPFIYNPEDSAAITATNTTLSMDLAEGHQYKSITVADTSDFPEEGGYICFNFGTDDAIYPVRYLSVLSATEIALDYTFKFTADVAEGNTVILLHSKVAYEPGTGDAGGFVATDSSAGRVAASEALQDILAAGMTVNETIQYPGDIGLGNAGEPNKVSDRVAIWAGDDIDDEVAAAQEELEDE